jgi:DNA-binding GntR family transcriptional regulator
MPALPMSHDGPFRREEPAVTELPTVPVAPPEATDPADYLGELVVRTLRLHDRREPKVIEIVQWIAVGIIRGDLRADHDLNSVELARRFGTSRTPVREALMTLEREGLVEILARRRPRVAVMTSADIADIYEVRADLLSRLARLVSERADDRHMEEITHHLDRLRRHAGAGDVEGYFYAHVAMQERLTEIARNGVLKQILYSLALRTLVLRHRSIRQPGRLQASLADQERLVDAFVHRDADLAAAVIAGATRAAHRAIVDSRVE